MFREWKVVQEDVEAIIVGVWIFTKMLLGLNIIPFRLEKIHSSWTVLVDI